MLRSGEEGSGGLVASQYLLYVPRRIYLGT